VVPARRRVVLTGQSYENDDWLRRLRVMLKPKQSFRA
jgi:hypothetical protein